MCYRGYTFSFSFFHIFRHTGLYAFNAIFRFQEALKGIKG